jgi:hypothetical protein
VRISIKRLALVVGAMVLNLPALAAGINSTAYTCTDLQALIMARGYIFVNNSNFQDFVVASAALCSGGEQAVLLSVPTSDRPQCPVNYCGPARGNRSD